MSFLGKLFGGKGADGKKTAPSPAEAIQK
jgi:hypothetical protein